MIKLNQLHGVINETGQGQTVYITAIENGKIRGFTDSSSDLVDYDSVISFKSLLELFLALSEVKKTDLAKMLDISKQMIRFKIDKDKFTRKELEQIRKILQMDNESFLLLMAAE